jgi:hypothetical protein
VKLAGILVVIALLPVCTSSDVYEEPAGWTAQITDGWHVLHFETTKGGASSTGTQFSNVELPPPTIHERLPIQASGLGLPADAVAIVIATDDDPANVQSPPSAPAAPPLSMDMFAEGSSTGEGPSLSLLWFACDDQPLQISLKQGPSLSKADRDSVETFVRSIGCSGADG